VIEGLFFGPRALSRERRLTFGEFASMEFAHPTGEGTLTQALRSEVDDSKSNRPWRWMLAVDCIIAPVALFYTVFVDSPRYPGYMHLLVTYHFGFVRRALVGTVLSWFTDAIPFWYVYAIAIAAWIVTLVLFVAVFRKVFGFKPENFPLFVFVIGSPFFFKNFAIALSHFDIYGCLWALVALLIPVGALYPLVIAGGCVVLVAMHHLHFLLYIPTIGFIVFVRYGLLPGFSTGKAIYGIALIALVSAAFLLAAFFGRMPAPPETFLAYVRSRALDPIDPSNAWMWYSTLEQEIRSTWERLGGHALRFPVYALLIALHLPIGRYLKTMIAKLPTRLMRRSAVIALAAITVGYVPICIVAHDYARWVSSWAVCMFLAMHAIRLLPSTGAENAPPLAPDSKTNLVLGWIVTAIPRVGVTIPF
jgi:hypothetical protein